MLLALTTNQKLGLGGTGVVFIAFALISALLIPRRNPDFPGGRGLVAFILVTVVFTIAMLGAVEVFAKEEHHGEAAGEDTTPQPEPAPGPQPEQPPPPTTTAEQPSGSAEAGKAVFEAQGCVACHTFTPAGAKGTVGPNLDEVLKGKDAAFVHESIVDPNAEVAAGFSAGVMPQDYEQKLTPKQLDDLVAFLTSG